MVASKGNSPTYELLFGNVIIKQNWRRIGGAKYALQNQSKVLINKKMPVETKKSVLNYYAISVHLYDKEIGRISTDEEEVWSNNNLVLQKDDVNTMDWKREKQRSLRKNNTYI